MAKRTLKEEIEVCISKERDGLVTTKKVTVVGQDKALKYVNDYLKDNLESPLEDGKYYIEFKKQVTDATRLAVLSRVQG